jgi:uncharacterized cupredoxin-like copper-binding protein
MRYVSLRLTFALLSTMCLVGAWYVEHSTAASGPAATINVTERDFHITAPKQVSSGNLLLKVSNKGPDQHELIVVRSQSTRLPIRSDGLTVNEAILNPVTEPSLEPGTPGSVRWLRLHLPPGHYVLFCNMAGHFMGGMHTDLEVR